MSLISARSDRVASILHSGGNISYLSEEKLYLSTNQGLAYVRYSRGRSSLVRFAKPLCFSRQSATKASPGAASSTYEWDEAVQSACVPGTNSVPRSKRRT